MAKAGGWGSLPRDAESRIEMVTRAAAPLTRGPRIAFSIAALAVAVALCLYWTTPPHVTTVTTARDADQQIVSTTTAVQEQRGDAVVVALLGLVAVMAVTGLTGGRLKFSAGGVSTEMAAAVGTAAETIGELKSRVDQSDPDVQAALERWSDTLGRLEGRGVVIGRRIRREMPAFRWSL